MQGNDYFGYKEVIEDEGERLAELYQDASTNRYDCLTNEYIILKNVCGEVIDILRWDGSSYVRVANKQINSRFLGKLKARNPQQSIAIDMLYNHDISIKMLAGKFGTGKTLLMCASAIDLIEHGKFDKIVYIRNNIEVKNSKPIGHLPGSNNEKLLPFAMPFCDHIGGVDSLELMINQGKLEITHLGFIRGRDFKNSIVMCSEVENMTREHIQLLISRIGEGSTLWLDGDVKQVDMDVFIKNSGMSIAIDRLKGHPKFGFVKLVKTERSETAAMADLLD